MTRRILLSLLVLASCARGLWAGERLLYAVYQEGLAKIVALDAINLEKRTVSLFGKAGVTLFDPKGAFYPMSSGRKKAFGAGRLLNLKDESMSVFELTIDESHSYKKIFDLPGDAMTAPAPPDIRANALGTRLVLVATPIEIRDTATGEMTARLDPEKLIGPGCRAEPHWFPSSTKLFLQARCGKVLDNYIVGEDGSGLFRFPTLSFPAKEGYAPAFSEPLRPRYIGTLQDGKIVFRTYRLKKAGGEPEAFLYKVDLTNMSRPEEISVKIQLGELVSLSHLGEYLAFTKKKAPGEMDTELWLKSLKSGKESLVHLYQGPNDFKLIGWIEN